jgi:hypothetical protein
MKVICASREAIQITGSMRLDFRQIVCSLAPIAIGIFGAFGSSQKHNLTIP